MVSQNYEWDFFLAHARADAIRAEELFCLLSPESRPFLDTRCLKKSDEWDLELPKAQRAARVTVVLVSSKTDEAFYQRAEIAEAIQLSRRDKDHRVVPLYLEKVDHPPYGLNLKHAIDAYETDSLAGPARQLLALLRRIKTTAWENSDHLLDINGYRVPYLPLINQYGSEVAELLMSQVEVKLDLVPYSLPKEFEATNLDSQFTNDASCRLAAYDLSPNKRLIVTLSETSYEDYLKSGEHLDDLLPGDRRKTFRDEFGTLVARGKTNFRPFDLPNICGAGIFVISTDNYVLITKHSNTSHVYPGRFTYSASGTIKWGAFPHPFTQVTLKSLQEIKHQVNLEGLRLIGFGADARKLFFQFSFYEKTAANITELTTRCPEAVHSAKIPFECGPIVEHLLNECWEPAAEASLLTLCVKQFGSEKLREALISGRSSWSKRSLRDEWDVRASRPGDLAVMSPRYPHDQLERASKKYVDAVMRFVGKAAKGKRVLEVGCGTGRITERLVRQRAKVVSLDISERMIERNRERLGKEQRRVDYRCQFAQDFKPKRQFDLVIASLVLIHNVADADFAKLVDMMCNCSHAIFVFEDASERRGTSPHTRLRSKSELIASFKERGIDVVHEKEFKLFDDTLLFLKLTRITHTKQRSSNHPHSPLP